GESWVTDSPTAEEADAGHDPGRDLRGLISGFRKMMRCEINANPAAPRASRACVRMPALLWCHCRSTPITAPRTRASRVRTASSSSDPGSGSPVRLLTDIDIAGGPLVVRLRSVVRRVQECSALD